MPDFFYIVDAHAWIYRAYHAPMSDLKSPKGEPTKATWQFTKLLFKLVKESRPMYIAVCFDSPCKGLKRTKWCPDYKAGRGLKNTEIGIQIERCRQIVQKMGLAMFMENGYEADDLIATLARRCVSDEVHVRLISRDKDMMQLLEDDRVRMLDPNDGEEFGAKDVYIKFQVKPSQLADYLSLVGDACDGVKGLPSVGPQTASNWLGKYGSLKSILALPEDLNDKQRKLIRTYRDQVKMAKRLVRLYDAPIEIDPEKLRCPSEIEMFNRASVIFKGLGFRSFV
jgi:DNA polymerase-1